VAVLLAVAVVIGATAARRPPLVTVNVAGTVDLDIKAYVDAVDQPGGPGLGRPPRQQERRTIP
jgi:hypothetical protein